MGAYQEIPIEQIHESKLNPRKHFDAVKLQELTESVRQKGILEPILVRPNAGGFELVAGARRLRAAKAAGLGAVPAIVRELSDEEALETMVIENLQRDDLHPLEEAAGYAALLKTPGHRDVARIAERVGRSVKYVYDRVKLLALTKPAQKLFLDGKMTAGHAILLARLRPEDQERAIVVGEDQLDRHPALFVHERTLWNPDDDGADAEEPLKAVSVREFQAWIDGHVKFDPAAADPMLFPETVATVTRAKEEAEKIIPITHEYQVAADARDGQRVFSERSWKRADGKSGSKTCDRSATGVIVVGPGRGEAFRVCVEKKKCKTHWAKEQREAKKRAEGTTKVGASSKDRYAIEERTRKEKQAREAAEQNRWKKALPAILDAVAEVVQKAPTKAGGALAQILIEHIEADTRRFGKEKQPERIGLGTTTEDLVRYLAFIVLRDEAEMWGSWEDFPKRAKAFGIDVRKIVDAAAPPEPKPEALAKKGKVEASGKRGKGNGKAATAPAVKPKKPAARACEICRCTELKACVEGCSWNSVYLELGRRVCSNCVEEARARDAKGGKKRARKGVQTPAQAPVDYAEAGE